MLDIDIEEFVAHYWQKKPCLLRNALSGFDSAVSPEELAGLACEEDVHCRLVLEGSEEKPWTVRYGPFEEQDFLDLPVSNYSLLVSECEKWMPELNDLLDQFRFIPDWRIDDLMISFAAPGGGVGPHRDNYDVFLCQGIGEREWRYSTAAICEDAAASQDLALTAEFAGDECHTVSAGDVLYLPPGVAHWGIARRACITYSIGMRAPPSYADPDLAVDEIQPGYLSPAALERAGTSARMLGCLVTEPKEWLRPDEPSENERTALLQSPSTLRKLRLHGMARLAFDDHRLYLNGASRALGNFERQGIAALCRMRRLNASLVAAIDSETLGWLISHGAFELQDHD